MRVATAPVSSRPVARAQPCVARLGQQLQRPRASCPPTHRAAAAARCAPRPGVRRATVRPMAFFGSGSKAQEPGDALGKEYDDMMPNWDRKRRAGIILHPTSLPGTYGIGEIGQEARAFVDWLASAGMQCWQLLPLVPPDPKYYSPYSGLDSNCGNPLLISLDDLIADGLLDAADRPPAVPVADVDFPAVAAVKTPLLQKAAARLLADPAHAALKADLEAWRQAHRWVEESALFDVLRQQEEVAELLWWEWPEPLRFRQEAAMKAARQQHASAIDEFVALQFLFDRQWSALKAYANERAVKLIGDMPIYVGGHSADVWANQPLFDLTADGSPSVVSGVPPDAFSETGQLWGSPLYRWKAHQQEGFKWWGARLGRALELYDETRIDHFRAFAGYWEVQATEETAMNGIWRRGPGGEMFAALKKQLGALPILAEDLGVITTDVVELREEIGAPGMVVLQFAWGGGNKNVHLPHMHYENSFCYPGTHDNETSVGWWGSTQEGDRKYLREYLGTDGSDIAWVLIRAAMQSISRTSIIMMQDVMSLGNEARMNKPGVAAGNWAWRVGDGGVWQRLQPEAQRLKLLADCYGRLPPKPKAAAADAAAAEPAKAEAAA